MSLQQERSVTANELTVHLVLGDFRRPWTPDTLEEFQNRTANELTDRLVLSEFRRPWTPDTPKEYPGKRTSQWEALMRKFSETHEEKCNDVSLNLPKVSRDAKQFLTGSKYEGTWDVVGMSGYGTYTFANGVVYKGEFEDGNFHGKGDLHYPNGVILLCQWNQGEMTERKLIFADGLEYAEHGWAYCKIPDRRFAVEYKKGLQPGGNSYLTAEQPTRDIPPGYYDTGDGFYDPKTKVVYKFDNLSAIVRSPSSREQKWIAENCRFSPVEAVGPRPDLYEEWLKPSYDPIMLISPALALGLPLTNNDQKSSDVMNE